MRRRLRSPRRAPRAAERYATGPPPPSPFEPPASARTPALGYRPAHGPARRQLRAREGALHERALHVLRGAEHDPREPGAGPPPRDRPDARAGHARPLL